VKYLLIIHMNPEAWDALPEEDRDATGAAQEPFMQSLKDSGEFVTAIALADPSNSRLVRVGDGGVPAVTDGPYLEAKEFLAGYYMVDVDGLDRALELAAQMPEARFLGGVEVRPVMFEHGLEM
jgi:hypothetical protein